MHATPTFGTDHFVLKDEGPGVGKEDKLKQVFRIFFLALEQIVDSTTMHRNQERMNERMNPPYRPYPHRNPS